MMVSCYQQTQTVQFMKLKHDVYEDFYEDKDLFDFSDYPQNSKFSDLVKKKVIGKMKGEFKEKLIMSLLN